MMTKETKGNGGDVSKLIAIDPGNIAGFAVFQSSLLISAFERSFLDMRVESVMLRSMATTSTPTRVVIEIPQVYPIRSWRGDPNDLIQVAIHVGIAAAAFAPYCKEDIELVTPRQWKGQQPKEINHQRTLDILGESEKQNIEKKKSSHTLDAIGLGLWALKRRK